jgi:hypothetical protein
MFNTFTARLKVYFSKLHVSDLQVHLQASVFHTNRSIAVNIESKIDLTNKYRAHKNI